MKASFTTVRGHHTVAEYRLRPKASHKYQMHHFYLIIGRTFGTLRAEKRQLVNRYFGKIEQFDGDAREICVQIVDRLWEGDFYRTSLGHFDFFWMRDFGTVAESLTNIGQREKVHHTLRWALRHYRKSGTVTLCIDSFGDTFNAPDVKSIDALPWLLHSIHVSGYELNKSDHEFLQKELRRYRKDFLDASGMILPIQFAELRDAVIYDRSAYAISLVARLAYCAKRLGLDAFPYHIDIYRAELLEHYWNGEYFNADARLSAFSAECAIMPFYLDIIDDPKLFKKTVLYIHNHRLNSPYPLRYTNQPDAFRYRWWMTAPFMPNYAGTSVWSWHGVFYLHVLKRYNLKEYSGEHIKFSEMIERHKTWPEMLARNGSWYKAPVYKGDPGMVWAALYIEL